MDELEARKRPPARGKWIDWYAIISPLLLIPLTNWYGYELFGPSPSSVRRIASFFFLLGIALSGSVASTVAAIRKSLPWMLLYWLAAVINAIAFIYFCAAAWEGGIPF